jgi:sugar phosphate isomerase/epimerase
MSALLARAAEKLPANKNVKWGLGSNLWNSFPGSKFTDILDVMRDTGFIALRVTQFPQILTKYDITISQLQKELEKRGVRIVTISFNGAANDPAEHEKVIENAKTAMKFLKEFGAHHLVVFSPRRGPGPAAFEIMCKFYNRLGGVAQEMGFQAGLHNHMGQMVQTPEEIDRCMEMTDPKLFHFSPDTAHVHLGGGDVPAIMNKHKHRLMLADYKDAKRDSSLVFPKNIFDLGDGEIDFPACHRVLKSVNFKSYLIVDLDIARNGPLASYQRCAKYVTGKLESIYV